MGVNTSTPKQKQEELRKAQLRNIREIDGMKSTAAELDTNYSTENPLDGIKVSILDDIQFYFLNSWPMWQQERIINALQVIVLSRSIECFLISDKTLKFEDIEGKCLLTGFDGETEIHNNSYAELAVNTLTKILMAPNLALNFISLSDESDSRCLDGNQIWHPFCEAFSSMLNIVYIGKAEVYAGNAKTDIGDLHKRLLENTNCDKPGICSRMLLSGFTLSS